MSKQKIIVLLVALLDVLSIGVLIPALPDMITWYHSSPELLTFGTTIYSLFAFFAAPLLGQRSDVHGRKNILILCVAGTALSFLVLIFTHSIWLYLLARSINGITGGNISILQAILTDISPNHQERAKNYGFLGAIFGLGFIIGPLVGGLLLHWGLVWIFVMGTVVAILELIVLKIFLPETHTEREVHPIAFNPFPIFKEYLFNSNNSLLFWSVLSIGVAGFSYQSVMSIYLNNHYSIPGEAIGYLMAGMGLISVFNQAILLRKVRLRFFSTQTLVFILNVALMCLFIALTFVHVYWAFVTLWFLSVPFIGLSSSTYNAEIMKHSKKGRIGQITGFMGSLQSCTMFLGPLVGTFFLSIHTSVFIASSFFALVSLAILQVYYSREAKNPQVA